MLQGKTIILGVTGCIAAYKAATIVSRLKDLGADIWVVMTKEGAQLVGPLTFRTLSGNPVVLDLYSQEIANTPVPHIALSQKADLIVIAPATANVIGKLAGGLADDALSTMALSTTAKKLLAPAMNCEMWRNPAVVANVEKARLFGWETIGPVEGKLACGDNGIGRMSEPEEIVARIVELLVPRQDLKGKKFLITAGGTREPLDPVRYLSNRSSGKMGYALAEAARRRGATVTLISANVNLPVPLDLRPIKVETAKDLLAAVLEHLNEADAVIMAAAVADFKVKNQKAKIKKETGLTLELEENPDILKAVARQKGNKKVVGFALETEDLIGNAKKKLAEKNLDLIVANGPENFDNDLAKVVLIGKSGEALALPSAAKLIVADQILDAVF
ncbi:MAG: bifunctional phosphopantothenoylcysteine decarboxylase/phosphopantothenate--cysteine ligase CoaBC [Candidatus Margulisiibacteriota bacterium]|jgi:phosphopantothenoylcysteine decarboxylase/phosphopantothenate--cysteine ligase